MLLVAIRLTAFAILLAVPTASGQSLPQVAVAGTVTDRNGAAVAGARVEFRGSAVVLDRTVTD